MTKKHTSETAPIETPEPTFLAEPVAEPLTPDPVAEAEPVGAERFIIPGTIQAVDRAAILGLGLDPDTLQREEPAHPKRKRP